MFFMKKTVLSFVALLLLSLSIISCKNSPKAVAKTFLTSLFQNDYEAAKKVSTKETQNMLSLMEELNSKVSDSAKKELMKVKVDIKSVTENGDKADVVYVTSENPKEQHLHMVKENGHWLAQWTKQDEMDGSDDQSPADQVAPDTTKPVNTDSGTNNTQKK